MCKRLVNDVPAGRRSSARAKKFVNETPPQTRPALRPPLWQHPRPVRQTRYARYVAVERLTCYESNNGLTDRLVVACPRERALRPRTLMKHITQLLRRLFRHSVDVELDNLLDRSTLSSLSHVSGELLLGAKPAVDDATDVLKAAQAAGRHQRHSPQATARPAAERGSGSESAGCHSLDEVAEPRARSRSPASVRSYQPRAVLCHYVNLGVADT